MAKLRSQARPLRERKAPAVLEPHPRKQGAQHGAAHSPGVDCSARAATRQLKRSKQQAAKVKGATTGKELIRAAFPEAVEMDSGEGIGMAQTGPGVAAGCSLEVSLITAIQPVAGF